MPMVRALIDDVLVVATKAMAKKVLGTCRSILNEGQARGLIGANVAREVRLRNSRRHEAEKVIPTKAEIRLLIEKAPERYRPVLLTAIFAGLRSRDTRLEVVQRRLRQGHHTCPTARRSLGCFVQP
jgi:integrase